MSLGRILLVDDDEGLGPAIAGLLWSAGFECHLCTTAHEANRVAAENEIDFALIDFDLGTTDPEDGAKLFRELEHDHPGMEMEVFSSKTEEKQTDHPKQFEILKYDIANHPPEKIEAAVMRGVNRGLKKRLNWQNQVLQNLRMRVAVLDGSGRAVWETGTEALATSGDLLAHENTQPESPISQAVRDRQDFNDLVEFPAGQWQTCELGPLVGPPPGPSSSSEAYRLLTMRDSTRNMKAENLTKEVLQYASFDKIAQRICEGLVELGFSRARLWILQGDNRTVSLYAERGHGLTTDQRRACVIDFRLPQAFEGLLRGPDSDAKPVKNSTEFLTPDICAILNITPDHQALAITLRVRDELLGLLMVDKVGAGCSDPYITLNDQLIGRQIGGLAAAALDRGIHEWQFERVQSILSQVQATQADDRIDEIYKPVFDEIINSLGNDERSPWLTRFQGAEIAVRASRFDLRGEYRRIYVTDAEKDILPMLVDIREGLVGEVMDKVQSARNPDRASTPHHYPNTFARPAFREQRRRILLERGPRDPYIMYLAQNSSTTMIPLLDLDKEVLGFLCVYARGQSPLPPNEDEPGQHMTPLHQRWLCVLGQLCSRIVEIRERHSQSVAMSNELYRQMVSKEAMAEFGEMSASITHEIKQYFQRLILLAELLKADILQPGKNPSARADAIANEVLSGSERLTTLGDLFKQLSNQTKGNVTVADAITRSLELVAKSVQESNVTCIRDIPEDLPNLPMSLDQALLIFSNLIKNACESIRDWGRTNGFLEVRAVWEPPHLTILVADNGGGIVAQNHSRLFQLGFTTKRGHRGMGVGLPLVRRVVEDHLGTITVDPPSPGAGATFRLVFRIPHATSQGTA